MDSDLYYIDVTPGKDTKYMFYYNFKKAAKYGVNEHVREIIGDVYDLALSQAGPYANSLSSGDSNRYKRGGKANLGIFDDKAAGVTEVDFSMYMAGITADVNKAIATEAFLLSQYYCPVDTGRLKNSGRIEYNDDGTCRIVYDCPYAWYVETFTWRNYGSYPTRPAFLKEAIEEVKRRHGIN